MNERAAVLCVFAAGCAELIDAPQPSVAVIYAIERGDTIELEAAATITAPRDAKITALLYDRPLSELQIEPGRVPLRSEGRPLPRPDAIHTLQPGAREWQQSAELGEALERVRLSPFDHRACANAGGCIDAREARELCKLPCPTPDAPLPPRRPRLIYAGPEPHPPRACSRAWIADGNTCRPPPPTRDETCAVEYEAQFHREPCAAIDPQPCEAPPNATLIATGGSLQNALAQIRTATATIVIDGELTVAGGELIPAGVTLTGICLQRARLIAPAGPQGIIAAGTLKRIFFDNVQVVAAEGATAAIDTAIFDGAAPELRSVDVLGAAEIRNVVIRDRPGIYVAGSALIERAAFEDPRFAAVWLAGSATATISGARIELRGTAPPANTLITYPRSSAIVRNLEVGGEEISGFTAYEGTSLKLTDVTLAPSRTSTVARALNTAQGSRVEAERVSIAGYGVPISLANPFIAEDLAVSGAIAAITSHPGTIIELDGARFEELGLSAILLGGDARAEIRHAVIAFDGDQGHGITIEAEARLELRHARITGAHNRAIEVRGRAVLEDVELEACGDAAEGATIDVQNGQLQATKLAIRGAAARTTSIQAFGPASSATITGALLRASDHRALVTGDRAQLHVGDAVIEGGSRDALAYIVDCSKATLTDVRFQATGLEEDSSAIWVAGEARLFAEAIEVEAESLEQAISISDNSSCTPYAGATTIRDLRVAGDRCASVVIDRNQLAHLERAELLGASGTGVRLQRNASATLTDVALDALAGPGLSLTGSPSTIVTRFAISGYEIAADVCGGIVCGLSGTTEPCTAELQLSQGTIDASGPGVSLHDAIDIEGRDLVDRVVFRANPPIAGQ